MILLFLYTQAKNENELHRLKADLDLLEMKKARVKMQNQMRVEENSVPVQCDL